MAENISEPIDCSKRDIFERLESFVRQCLRQQKIEVINFTEISPLPPGENNCSLVIKLCMSVRESDNDKREVLALIAKMEMQCENSFVDWSKSFEKESFVYTKLLPAYREIERAAGIEESQLVDILPRYFSANANIDENSILLMEDLTFKGFYNVRKNVGIDIEHAKMALSTLARYHALGIALKQKRSSLALFAMKTMKLPVVCESLRDSFVAGICKQFRNCARLAKYENSLKVSLASYRSVIHSDNFKPKEPWATITHGDFWTNNILFAKNTNGTVDSVKIIDFQLSLYASPLMDLPYFFCTSFDETDIDENYDELVSTYYDAFLRTLNRVGCDSGPFTRQSFDCDLKEQAEVIFTLNVIVKKLLAYADVEIDNGSGELKENFAKEWERIFLQRVIKLVSIYEKRGWF